MFLYTFCLLMASSACSNAKAQPTGGGKQLGFKASGSLRNVFEYEKDELSGHDFDFSSFLQLDVLPLVDPRVSFHFYGRARFDLDAASEIDDALDCGDKRVFQAYLELVEIPDPLSVRLGRQWIHDVEGVHLDGVKIEAPLWRTFALTVFAGRPVSEYSDVHGQAVLGGQLRVRPLKNTVVRIHGVRSDEKNPRVNDQIGIHLNQRLGKSAQVYYDHTFLNRRGKELRLGGTAYISALELELRGNYYERLDRSPKPERDDVKARYFTDYFLILGSMEQTRRFGLTATRYFGSRLALTGGLSLTDVRQKEDPTNRDSDQYFISVQIFQLFIKRLSLSLDANWVSAVVKTSSKTTFTDIDGSSEEIATKIKQDDQTFLITGQLQYKYHEKLTLAAGCSYGDFDFDRALKTNQTVLDTVPRALLETAVGDRFITRTYFSEIHWRINRRWSTKARAEYNHSKINTGESPGDFGRFLLNLRYRF